MSESSGRDGARPGSTRSDALVLDLGTRAGLAIARDLGRRGLRVSVAAHDPSASGFRTRHACVRAVLPDPELDRGGYLRGLLEHLERHPADVVLPSIDASVAVLHEHREEFARVTAPALASHEAVETALSKSRTLELARALGVGVPRSHPVDSAEDAAAVAAELAAPVVVKPDESWVERGVGGERLYPVCVADGRGAAREAGRMLGAGAARVLVQELAPGRRETVKLFRSGGHTLARLVIECSRTWPPLGGSSVMRRTIAPPPDIADAAERLVAEIGLEGYSEAEFRRDREGRPLLMEVNPRLSQSVEVAVRAGVDFPRMQLEWARGGRVEPVSRYALGVRVGWLAGDLRLLAAALLRSPAPPPPLGATAAAIAGDYVLRGARLEGLDPHDLRPVLAAIAFAARGVVRPRGTRRLFPSPG